MKPNDRETRRHETPRLPPAALPQRRDDGERPERQSPREPDPRRRMEEEGPAQAGTVRTSPRGVPPFSDTEPDDPRKTFVEDQDGERPETAEEEPRRLRPREERS